MISPVSANSPSQIDPLLAVCNGGFLLRQIK